MTTEAKPRARWGHEATGKGPARIARVAYILAPAFGCQPRTVAHWLDELPALCARIIGGLRQAGEHARAAQFTAALTKSQTPAPPLTDALLLDLSEADAQEGTARDAYELSRGPVERDTLTKKLRKEIAVATVTLDALEASV